MRTGCWRLEVYRGGLVRTISLSYRVVRSNLDVRRGNFSRCFSPESGNADTRLYRFAVPCLSRPFFFMSALAFQRLVVARVFFYEIVKTLKRWLAFSRHVMFADIFSFLFHASLWRIRETASKRYTVVDYSVNHWKFIHLRKQVAFPDCTFEVEKKYIIKFAGEYPYSFSDSTPP